MAQQPIDKVQSTPQANPLLNDVTGGASQQALDAANQGLEAYEEIQNPTTAQLTLPELQQYAIAQNMTPAQMRAFLQANNAYNTENVGQQGTSAQEQALEQLANVANAGVTGTPQEQAQIAQALEQSNQNLAGQRGAIDQAAEARGVSPGLLQAALSQQNAGQDAQNANQAALQAQSQAYQAALQAMASGANAGNALQGQQNTQANTIAAAQNAMEQFNAANQQNAAATNAGYQQQANAANTDLANQVGQANTGLANQRTIANTGIPEEQFQNELQKAGGITNAATGAANTATAQGQQNAGLLGGLLGTAGTVIGGIYGGPAGAAVGGKVGNAAGNAAGSSDSTTQQAAHGAIVQPYAKGGVVNPIPAHYDCNMANGGITMKQGGMIPGKAKVPGDSKVNDTVPIRVSPGEAVVPRTVVQQNPADVMRLLAQGRQANPQRPAPQVQAQSGHHPQDIATLLAAMKQMRGGK